jgi:hypothetical protein
MHFHENTHPIECTKQAIRSAIARSRVPEDRFHAENTREWLLKLNPDADEALRIAALGHDIDRAMESLRVRKTNFSTFDEFKAAHARNSAVILGNILHECGVDPELRDDVCRLVARHETGGDERSDLIKDADSLSFFAVNLPYFAARNDWDTIERRSVWGYARLSPRARELIRDFSYRDEKLNALLAWVISRV